MLIVQIYRCYTKDILVNVIIYWVANFIFTLHSLLTVTDS